MAFLLTCRTVYIEAIPIYYGHQRFCFELPSSSHRDLVYDWVHHDSPLIWLNQIGSRNCAYIRHILIECATDYDVETDNSVQSAFTIHPNGAPGDVKLYRLATEVAFRLIKRLPGLESLSLEFQYLNRPFDPPAVVLAAAEALSKLKYLHASVMRHGLADNSPIVKVLRRRPAFRNPYLEGTMAGRITAAYLDGPGTLKLYDGIAYTIPREQRVSEFWQAVAPMKELEIWDHREIEQLTSSEIRAVQISQQAGLENLVLFIFRGGISSELAQALKECVKSMEKLKSFTLLPRLECRDRPYRALPWHVDSSLLTYLPPNIESLLLALRVSDRWVCESHCATMLSRCKKLKRFWYTYCDAFGFLGDRAPLQQCMPRLLRAGVDARLHSSYYSDDGYAQRLPTSDIWCY